MSKMARLRAARPISSQRAQEHTTFVLTGMLKSMGFEKIDIVFQVNALPSERSD